MPPCMVVFMFVVNQELFDKLSSLDDEAISCVKEVSNRTPEPCFHIYGNKDMCLFIDDKTIVEHAKNIYNLIMSIKSKDDDLIRSAVVQLKMTIDSNPDLKTFIENC